jgi:hypothetical protein
MAKNLAQLSETVMAGTVPSGAKVVLEQQVAVIVM